jgi:hypothetical protein
MSHFTHIKTRMVEKEHLVAALRDLGYVPEEGRLQARGWNGTRTPVEVRVAIKNSGYDVGFRHTAEGYEVVADWFGIRDLDRDEFVRRLTRRYAYHATRAKLEEQGFTLVSEEGQEDGRVHLVLRRMA